MTIELLLNNASRWCNFGSSHFIVKLFAALEEESKLFLIQADLVWRDCFIATSILSASCGVNRAAKKTVAGCVPIIGLPVLFFILVFNKTLDAKIQLC